MCQAAGGGGVILEGDPTEWLTKAYDKLRDLLISSDRWVLTLVGHLSRTVWHAFQFHFGQILEKLWRTLVEVVFPFTDPATERDFFEAVSFEEFWRWLLCQAMT